MYEVEKQVCPPRSTPSRVAPKVVFDGQQNRPDEVVVGVVVKPRVRSGDLGRFRIHVVGCAGRRVQIAVRNPEAIEMLGFPAGLAIDAE